MQKYRPFKMERGKGELEAKKKSKDLEGVEVVRAGSYLALLYQAMDQLLRSLVLLSPPAQEKRRFNLSSHCDGPQRPAEEYKNT